MPTLKEFLASQAERLRSQESDAAQRRDEWLASLNRLFSQIRTWIRRGRYGVRLVPQVRLCAEEGSRHRKL